MACSSERQAEGVGGVPLLPWLRERATKLRYTNIAYLVLLLAIRDDPALVGPC